MGNSHGERRYRAFVKRVPSESGFLTTPEGHTLVPKEYFGSALVKEDLYAYCDHTRFNYNYFKKGEFWPREMRCSCCQRDINHAPFLMPSLHFSVCVRCYVKDRLPRLLQYVMLVRKLFHPCGADVWHFFRATYLRQLVAFNELVVRLDYRTVLHRAVEPVVTHCFDSLVAALYTGLFSPVCSFITRDDTERLVAFVVKNDAGRVKRATCRASDEGWANFKVTCRYESLSDVAFWQMTHGILMQ
jgi:hypothetical protein